MAESERESTKHEELRELSLLDELTAACQQGCAIKIDSGEFGLLEALNSQDSRVSTAAILQLHKLGDKLYEFVVKDGRFPGDKQLMVRSGDGVTGFYPRFVGVPLVRRAIEAGSPEAAIEWLQKVLATTFATGKTIRALWGVPVEQEIQITPDVKIVPIDKLLDSVHMRSIAKYTYSMARTPSPIMLDLAPFTSALVVTRRIEPFFDDSLTPPTLANDEHSKQNDLFLDIALALTVVGPRVAISGPEWFAFDERDLEEARMFSSRTVRMHEILPRDLCDYPMLDPEEAPQIVQAFLALHGDTRHKVRLALKRLSQAQLRHDYSDRYVEQSIALETLLGDDETTGMTHKISARSARLIGGTEEVRKKNAAVIKQMYSTRSTVVHSGHIKNPAKLKTISGRQMSVFDIANYTVNICVDLIKIIIRRGSIPDWQIFDITENAK